MLMSAWLHHTSTQPDYPRLMLSLKMNGYDKLSLMATKDLGYFEPDIVRRPTWPKVLASRLAFPLLCLLSREQSLKLGLIPIDDERVIQAMKEAKGRVLDIGSGANNFVRRYGNGIGVDIVGWKGCDLVITDAAKLPFKDGEFDTVSYIACLNHIPNMDDSFKEAYRVTKNGGKIIVPMIKPPIGKIFSSLSFTKYPRHPHRSTAPDPPRIWTSTSHR